MNAEVCIEEVSKCFTTPYFTNTLTTEEIVYGLIMCPDAFSDKAIYEKIMTNLSLSLQESYLFDVFEMTSDEVKENSVAFIQQLKSWGITPLMATGDNDSAARKVADKLDIDYLANQSPQDKYALVERLKQQQLTTMMVGDGVNDGPALALADIGVAIGQAGNKGLVG